MTGVCRPETWARVEVASRDGSLTRRAIHISGVWWVQAREDVWPRGWDSIECGRWEYAVLHRPTGTCLRWMDDADDAIRLATILGEEAPTFGAGESMARRDWIPTGPEADRVRRIWQEHPR